MSHPSPDWDDSVKDIVTKWGRVGLDEPRSHGIDVHLAVSYKTLLLIYIIFDVLRRIVEALQHWVSDIKF